MKVLFFVLIFSFLIGSISAQSDLNKMVETEKAFARMAAENARSHRVPLLDHPQLPA